MTQSKTTRSIIDTHRHIFGPKLLQEFVENRGFDDAKPLPQANAGEMFFYRESVDVDYSMEIQRRSGVTSCANSYGAEVETFAQHIIKASTVDTLKFWHDESFELRDRFPDEVACMANAHALEENMRAVIDPSALARNDPALLTKSAPPKRPRQRPVLGRQMARPSQDSSGTGGTKTLARLRRG